MGSIIKSFKKRVNNDKSPMRKNDQGGRKMEAEHLYAHFLGSGHKGLGDVSVIFIDKTNINEPTQREAFWVYKLDTFVPRRLNVRDFE